MSSQIIVAGSHGSGASLVSPVLYRAGAPLGDRLSSSGPGETPHGRFEDPEVVSLHEKILEDNGLTWQVTGQPPPVVEETHRQQIRELVGRRSEGHELWGFQDPRVCLLLEEWKELALNARFLLVYGNPVEVCRTLHQQHADSMIRATGDPHLDRKFWETPDLALKMWLTYNRALLEFARENPAAAITVSLDMLRQEFPLVATLNDRWGLNLRRTHMSEILDTGVIVGSARQPVLDEDLIGETLEVWEALETLGREIGEIAGTDIAPGERLTEEDFYVPSDAYSLLMESEFLSFKARAFEEDLKEAERLRQELKAQLEPSASPQRMLELESAERDLQLIIGRMSRSRLAPLFRVKKEFQELEQKYLK